MKIKTRKARSAAVGFCLGAVIATAGLVSLPDLPRLAPWAAAEMAGNGGQSVHFKNARTPEWMLEGGSQSAGQMPNLLIKPADSYWI